MPPPHGNNHFWLPQPDERDDLGYPLVHGVIRVAYLFSRRYAYTQGSTTAMFDPLNQPSDSNPKRPVICQLVAGLGADGRSKVNSDGTCPLACGPAAGEDVSFRCSSTSNERNVGSKSAAEAAGCSRFVPSIASSSASRAGIRPDNGIRLHFRRTHSLKGEVLRQIIDYSYAVGPISNPHTVPVPADDSPHIEQLPVLDGFRCSDCRFLTTSRKLIRVHRSQSGHDSDWKEVRLQTLSPGSHARYWVVKEGTRGIPGLSTHTATSSQHALLERVARYEENLATELEETRRTVDSRQGADFESTWVREMGWARHLAGSDFGEHFQAGRNVLTATERARLRCEADISEQKRLLRLGASFDRLIVRGIERTGQVPKEVLRYLASVDPDRPAGGPFRTENGQDTKDRYQAYWKRYLYYCVRTGRLGRDEAAEKFRIRFNDAQWAVLTEIIRQLDSSDPSVQDNDRDDASLASSTYIGSEEAATPGHGQKVAVHLFSNPLLHFTVVLGISSSRKTYAWRPATEFTPLIAGLVWCARLILLDAMIRMMTYGKGFRKKEGGTPRLMWEDNKDALRYLGNRIPLNDFRVMAASIVTDAEELLDQLMFREWIPLSQVVVLRRIKDSLSFEGPGASFATHEDNSWLEPRFRRLIGPCATQLWDDEAGIFRAAKVQQWLGQLQSFRQALLVSTHTWGGQPGRGPEIITIRHCDTQDMLRNVFIFDGQVMLVTDRDKGKAIRGIGRKVARFLPDTVGRLMVAYILWLLPFERLLLTETKAQELSKPLDA
ncbi:uncharacterized protein B0I36DRAFT_367985 [Microdochium trichocladiopsis]|uniref:C2H2-type domain-containing protein n=1 Tax=Microdochium trichocladiopsis TaxID=1682393 RepID=A0A9P8XY87_9PEZI|nr:uncharacterized protein B0I36DRAFT_367985 [Microdochium trichocladiopsis]KAH7021617.1 hypothetical protein B0I36DRAFT_367985 [Microdochium trichocladiopsis]